MAALVVTGCGGSIGAGDDSSQLGAEGDTAAHDLGSGPAADGASTVDSAPPVSADAGTAPPELVSGGDFDAAPAAAVDAAMPRLPEAVPAPEPCLRRWMRG